MRAFTIYSYFFVQNENIEINPAKPRTPQNGLLPAERNQNRRKVLRGSVKAENANPAKNPANPADLRNLQNLIFA
jgi:hypothetical protein